MPPRLKTACWAPPRPSEANWREGEPRQKYTNTFGYFVQKDRFFLHRAKQETEL